MKFLKFNCVANYKVLALTLFTIVYLQSSNQAKGQCTTPKFSNGCNSTAITSIAIINAANDTVYNHTSKVACDKPLETSAINTIALKPNSTYTLFVKSEKAGNSVGAFLSNDGDNSYSEFGIDTPLNLINNTTNGSSSRFTVTGINGGTLRIRILSSVGKRSYVLNDACSGAEIGRAHV